MHLKQLFGRSPTFDSLAQSPPKACDAAQYCRDILAAAETDIKARAEATALALSRVETVDAVNALKHLSLRILQEYEPEEWRGALFPVLCAANDQKKISPCEAGNLIDRLLYLIENPERIAAYLKRDLPQINDRDFIKKINRIKDEALKAEPKDATKGVRKIASLWRNSLNNFLPAAEKERMPLHLMDALLQIGTDAVSDEIFGLLQNNRISYETASTAWAGLAWRHEMGDPRGSETAFEMFCRHAFPANRYDAQCAREQKICDAFEILQDFGGRGNSEIYSRMLRLIGYARENNARSEKEALLPVIEYAMRLMQKTGTADRIYSIYDRTFKEYQDYIRGTAISLLQDMKEPEAEACLNKMNSFSSLTGMSPAAT